MNVEIESVQQIQTDFPCPARGCKLTAEWKAVALLGPWKIEVYVYVCDRHFKQLQAELRLEEKAEAGYVEEIHEMRSLGGLVALLEQIEANTRPFDGE